MPPPSTSPPSPPSPPSLRRSIGFWGATGVMIGVIIGSGIFRTPSEIAAVLGSPQIILLLWALGGVLCLFGALTYAELAAMFPASGGVYVFVREGFGHCAAFVFGWSYMLLVKPFAAAGIAFVFAESINALLGVHWDPRVTTTIMLTVMTLVNIRGVGLAAGVATFLTAIKFAALIGIVVLALILQQGSTANFQPDTSILPSGLPAFGPSWSAFVPVMAMILWTYDGWADVGAIAGEVKDPQRTLPRIFILGTLATIALYLAVNATYFWLLPMSEMRSAEGGSVAPLVMQKLLGAAGSAAVLVVIILSTLGSTHSSIMTGARVSYAQSRDGLLFRFISGVHHSWHTPHIALIVQLALSITSLWLLGSFQRLADGFVFTMWIFYAMGGLSLFILRRTQPNISRPFRCPGYPIIPALFVLSALAMTILGLLTDTPLKLGSLGVLAAGIPIYFIWKRISPTPPSTPAVLSEKIAAPRRTLPAGDEGPE